MELIHAHEEEIKIKLSTVPVSIQAKKESRDTVSTEIRSLVSEIPFLFSGDVGVTIQLWREAQQHYESDRTADIDNVIKPILDGLAGPDGVMIDDNQVQNVQCYWIEQQDAPKAILTISNPAREYVFKKDLIFVHMGKHLYFPMNDYGHKMAILMLDMLQKYKDNRVQMEADGVGYNDLRYFLPTQRIFHKTRLAKFHCIEIEDARRELTQPT
jgi:Holliday junction resolvase RusA-like endonuclease